jgi:hypothetical protein
MSVLPSTSTLLIIPFAPKKRGPSSGFNAVFSIRMTAFKGPSECSGLGKVPRRIRVWVRGSSLRTLSNVNFSRSDSDFGAAGLDIAG